MGYSDPDEKRAYQREWVAKRRENFFKGKECSNCGFTEMLELHHLDPSKKVSHNIWGWSEQRRKIEIEKCVILCHDCHKIETKKQYAEKRRHGTGAMYKRGCTCQECRGRNAARMRVQRKYS